jgi:two-component system OmpR family sensor kinase
MKRESVFFTITVSFIISMLLVIVSFSVIVHNKGVFKEKHLSKKYFPIVKKFLLEHKKSGITPILVKDLEVMNMEIIRDKGIRTALLYNPETKVLVKRRLNRFQTRVLKLNKINYVYIKNRHDEFLLKDNNTEEDHGKFVFFLVFGVILMTLIISFLTTLIKLYPLKILKDKVTTLGDENFDFDCCDTTKKDEVSLLALEFKNTAEKLQSLKESRNVFIRNIMHELKTPITKGRFLIATVKSLKCTCNFKLVVSFIITSESIINLSHDSSIISSKK